MARIVRFIAPLLLSLFSVSDARAQRLETGAVARKLPSRALAHLVFAQGTETRSVVIKDFNEGTCERSLFENITCRVVSPGIRVVHGSPNALSNWLKREDSLLAELTPPMRWTLDRSRTYVRAEDRDLPVLSKTLEVPKGKNVYIAVIDSGVDIFHQEFRNTDGTTRIAYYLDMSMTERTDHPLDKEYHGRVFDSVALNEMLKNGRSKGQPVDSEGHGTHVASIALGNGLSGDAYRGIAPMANLIAVRATRDDNGGVQEADVLLGAKFASDMATKDQMPLVINLSLGTQFGPHDGSTLLEQSLTAMTKQNGRAVVVAASNEGNLAIHTRVRISPGGKASIPLRLPGRNGSGEAYLSAGVYVYLRFHDFKHMRVGLKAPGGSTLIEPLSSGESSFEERNGLSVIVANETQNKEIFPLGVHAAIVTFRGASPAGDYSIELDGDALVEAYVQGAGESSDMISGPMFPKGALLDGTIGIPASAPELIAVGAVGTRTSFVNRDEDRLILKFPFINDRCDFSSMGPNALGVMKPDVLAPGNFVIGALSSTLSTPYSKLFSSQVIDDTHLALAGTSMSAPFVSGALALLLEADRTLSSMQMRRMLWASAKPILSDSKTLSHETGRGFGALDVKNMFQLLNAPAKSSATTLYLRMASTYLNSDRQLPLYGFLQVRSDNNEPIDVNDLRLFATNAQISEPLSRMERGLYRFALLASAGIAGTHAHIRIQNTDSTLWIVRSIPMGADSFDARDGLRSSGGGCSCNLHQRHSEDWTIVFSLFLALSAYFRRRQARSYFP